MKGFLTFKPFSMEKTRLNSGAGSILKSTWQKKGQAANLTRACLPASFCVNVPQLHIHIQEIQRRPRSILALKKVVISCIVMPVGKCAGLRVTVPRKVSFSEKGRTGKWESGGQKQEAAEDLANKM